MTRTYDAFNHLTNVTMARPEGTQTRTFQYNGLDMVSATNPENGTVTYTYDASHKVLTRTDAKNQQTQYTYDQYGRVTQVLHGVVSNGVFTADTSQTWTLAYDTNIRLQQINTTGRLAAITVGSSQTYGSGITYEYNYTQGGRIYGQKIHVEQILPQAIDFNVGYSWNLEGRLTESTDTLGADYGSQIWGYEYQFDSAGRPNTLLQIAYPSDSQSTIATATYGPANEMTSLSYGSYTETRTYNSLLQLTRQTIPGVFDTEYVFPAGLNNGRITSSIDHIGGDQVNYTYDALERLTHAETVSSAWGQTYAFDGFGNLTAKTVTKGSGSNWAQAYDPATNHMTGNPLITYDPNGNIIDQNLQQTYDVENHVTTETIDVGSTSHPTWYYDASGKRVVEIETLANGNKQWTLYAYDISGHPYATLTGDSYNINVPTRNAYFGDRLIQSNGAWVVTDRLGSVRANSNGETFSYLPYGEERTATANSRIKFGTYFRDSTTYNQDYADQRYYNPWYGRFNSPDPTGAKAVDPKDSTSWNMYAYAQGDPVNFNDASGRYKCWVGVGEGAELTDCEDVSVYIGNNGPGPAYFCVMMGIGCPDFAALQWLAQHPMPTPTGNSDRDKLRWGMYVTDNDAVFGPQILDCIAGLESSWDPNAKNGNFNGLYQINSSTWYDSGTTLDYATNVNDVAASTAVTVAELYKKLRYEFSSNAAYGAAVQAGFTADQIQTAISNFGEGNTLYGKDVLGCANAMTNGNYAAAQGFIDDYHKNRPN